MEIYTIEQGIKVIQAGHSNQKAYRALCPNVQTTGKIVQNFDQTESVEEVKTPVHARTAHTAKNIAAVRDSVAEGRSDSYCKWYLLSQDDNELFMARMKRYGCGL